MIPNSDMENKMETRKVRAKTEWEYSCTAPNVLFTDNWESAPQETLETMNKQNGLPCDGGGRPGPWCTRCHWGQEEDFDSEYPV